MVHLWVSLQNERINKPCLNKRVTRIFSERDGSFFYGDNCIDIYIAAKCDYEHLEGVVRKVVSNASGWVRNCRERERVERMEMRHIVGECGHISHRSLRKLFPRKDGDAIWEETQCDVYRNDGNFKMFAWETARFYYVLCFDTS
jgi:hypothetical protein